jgi:hypothetical protein
MTGPSFSGPPKPEAAVPAKPAKHPPTTPDETGHASFPASDPPAVWTWEVKKGLSGK